MRTGCKYLVLELECEHGLFYFGSGTLASDGLFREEVENKLVVVESM